MNELSTLYRQWTGEDPLTVEKLPGAGSNREYYRIGGGEALRQLFGAETVVGCVGTSREENHAFVALARHFREKGLPVPQVYAVSTDEMCYLQQDLGTRSLFDALSSGRQAGGNYSSEEQLLLRQTIRLLPRLQFVGAEGLDFSVCYPQPAFDADNVMFDLNYFKYCFLKPVGIDFNERRLEQDFRQMAADLTAAAGPTAFMYRDFQARNVMLAPTPCFIDFQGGRRGPVCYDLASFLWQASARYPEELRHQLVGEYYAEASRYADLPPRENFDRLLRRFVFFRLLQVLGAYGFRGYFERKAHFLQSIQPAIDSLRQLLAQVDMPYACLADVLRRLPDSHPAAPQAAPEPDHLVVSIYSFSYKRGIPDDPSGNGGGYVFDCRSTHNPGRYERYKQLTGLDEPVRRFLEDDGEILRFLEAVRQLADHHVSRYLERGFTHLMFAFGCTGGQHRSVYSAQHLAEHIHQQFPSVEVRLCHREQGIERVFLPTL